MKERQTKWWIIEEDKEDEEKKTGKKINLSIIV